MLALLAIVVFAPVILIFLPRRWALLGFGVSGLGWAWLWLSLHVEPFNESNYRGFDVMLLGAWAVIAIVGLLLLSARPLVFTLLFPNRTKSRKPEPIALWPLPIGVLVAIFFMHWLSNRLAGAEPAWLVHLAVGGAGLLATVLVWWLSKRFSVPRALALLGAAFCLGVVGWVALGAYDANQLSNEARVIAGSHPHCLLTYAGRDHPRPADHVLELSRLVSRSGGRDFVEDAHWVVVARPEGLVELRRHSFMGDASFETRSIESAACTPQQGGPLFAGFGAQRSSR